ncbi:hypothetical protein [Saccharothrix sp. NRRL B-16314]|uniref:hypothetical protein n=1 Tax=Saccharothrix sp. NRRL B-16314 TaxID=1463825 RepID=UPI0012DCCDEE|nr:hypothetical protein [Saccharothrix sp. NRRL B-16314]
MSSRTTLPVVALGGLLLLGGCAGALTPPEKSTPSSTSATTISADPAALGEFTAIPRTNILLRVPDGMVVDEKLSGLGEPGTRNTIVVTNMPVGDETPQDAMNQMIDGFTGPKAAAVGLELGEVRRLTIAGRPAVVTAGVQRQSGQTYVKAIAVLASDDVVVMISGTAEENGSLSADDMLGVLTSARWSAETAGGDRGFDLTPAAGYETKDAVGGAILFTLGGASGTGAPKLLAAPSLGQAEVAEDRRRSFAVTRFEGLPAKPSVESTTAVEIDGLPGFELTGRGSRAGETAYAAILFTDDGYFVIAGDFDPAAHPDQLPAFQEMARSLVVF